MITLESIGFAERGKGADFLLDEKTTIDGILPVNPSGGLLCKGHPLGATGPGQIYEIVKQLKGQAGKRQVDGARIGLQQNGGGFLHVDGGFHAVGATPVTV